MMYTATWNPQRINKPILSPDLFNKGSFREAVTKPLPTGSEEETQIAEDDLTTIVKSNNIGQVVTNAVVKNHTSGHTLNETLKRTIFMDLHLTESIGRLYQQW